MHKDGAPLRPILSAIGSAVHGPVIGPYPSTLTINQHTVTNSFLFSEELRNNTIGGFHLASFDICSLFTNIPLNETINIITEANRKGELPIKSNEKNPGRGPQNHHRELRFYI